MRPADVDVSVISAAIHETTRTGRLTIPVRSVGADLARGLAAAVTIDREDAIGESVARGNAPSVIAAGESAWLWFEDTAGAASAAPQTPLVRLPLSEEDLVVEVAYSEVAGRQDTASSLRVTRSGRTDRSYRITKVVPGHPRRFTVE
jgi:hypothetical protein